MPRPPRGNPGQHLLKPVPPRQVPPAHPLPQVQQLPQHRAHHLCFQSQARTRRTSTSATRRPWRNHHRARARQKSRHQNLPQRHARERHRPRHQRPRDRHHRLRRHRHQRPLPHLHPHGDHRTHLAARVNRGCGNFHFSITVSLPLACVLREGRKNASILGSSGAIRRIPNSVERRAL